MKSLQIAGNARYGGATYLMIGWSKYLLEQGCEVHALCTDERMMSEFRKTPAVRIIDSIFIPREISPVTDLRAFARLMALLRREHYDVVHTYTATPSFLGRVAARLAGVPVTVNHQGGWAVNEESSLPERLIFTPLEYLATLACTRNICVSHSEMQKAKELHLAPRRKLVTIVNGMNARPFVEAAQNKATRQTFREALKVSAEQVVIGNTGRLVPGKGNDVLIRALAHLNSLLPETPVVLALAGDGTDRERLEALIASLNLQDQVHLLGFYTDIPAFLAGIDIFVTPTFTEGMSISLLEAMAAACPIVASDIPANAELIKHEVTGLLSPVKSAEQTAHAIARLIKDPASATRWAKTAQQQVLDYYTLDRMFAETWELYQALYKGDVSAQVFAES